MQKLRESVLLRAAILLLVIWAGLEFGMPLFTAPLPASLIYLFLGIAVSGILLYITLTEEGTQEVWGAVADFLAGKEGAGPAMKYSRLAVLALAPFLVGWQTYVRMAPSDEPPLESRTIHPAPPGEFVGLANPLPGTPENITEGQGRYFSLCFPCHGAFDGKGPAAPGFDPPPADFKDPGTIAQLQESYLFWRIKKGGVGLPVEGMPWKSAMPRWEEELSDEDIWKIVMGEYAGAGHEPRTWEEEE